jgi:AcrR family transcriptional regulator
MIDAPKKRGRPRAYDPDQALDRARSVFWDAGYASSSLDELGAAMSMNRPSLYGAFGDKEALYLRTLEGYRQESLALLRKKLDPTRPLRQCLQAVYAGALDIYLGGEAPRGCFLIGTATVEAVMHPAVRRILRDSLADFDQAIAARFRLAIEQGELEPAADPSTLSGLASAVMHSLAVRARAGDCRRVLEKLARSGVEMICGREAAASPLRRRKR